MANDSGKIKKDASAVGAHHVDTHAREEHSHGLQGATSHWINSEWSGATASLLLFATGLLMDYAIRPEWFINFRFFWYGAAYLPVGAPVFIKGVKLAYRGQIFTEFLLMSIATIGAFYIGEYPEGVAVMLFYTIGELFQGAAVNHVKRNIKALLDVRPDTASVLRNGKYEKTDPTSVQIADVIQIKAGERVPLDGTLLSEGSSFNTSALTGESRPISIEKGETVLAGMINEDRVVEMKVTRLFNESSLARILTLVQAAQGRKAKTELFIRRFASVYTPIVVFLAVGLTLIPYFFVDDYHFNEWLYRALIFLVISCPCALVVAIPLGYFGGIGAASRNGILFKGSSYLDKMKTISTVVFDKTGTLTKGVFEVRQVVSGDVDEKDWLSKVAALEIHSTHPVAKAITAYAQRYPTYQAESVEEIKGHGIKGTVMGEEILAGNTKIFNKYAISYDSSLDTNEDAVVMVAVNRKFAGYIVIADEIKDDAIQAVRTLQHMGIQTIMLSGDRQPIVDQVAQSLSINKAFGGLLPENKVESIEKIKQESIGTVAFVGDGINDAPVLAMSDVGIAMGGLGSDAAIETADVIIQTDQPSKIRTAIDIGKATSKIIWQNIALAFGVKMAVMVLGASGVASMWEAVFADVGVALLAILNAIRIQRMKFK